MSTSTDPDPTRRPEPGEPPDDERPPGAMAMVLRVARELGIVVAVALPLMVVAGWLRAPSLPDEAPPFTLQDLDGNPVSLADFRGQTVVLNFWATWCGPCRAEAPWFASFSQEHPEIPVIGVVADGPPPKVRAVAKDLGITYTVVSADREVLEAYGVNSFPTTVVVNPDGTVGWAHVGMMLKPHLVWATGAW